MITWFTKHAPVRRKFTVLIAATVLLGLVNLLGSTLVLWQVISPATSIVLSILDLVAATGMMVLVKELICRSYIETVVRMEKLAAGDLTSPIRCTDHTDCVGRMTKAMDSFRDNALRVKEAEADQSVTVVEVLSGALDRRAQGDLTHRISGMPAGEHERLQDAFNG